MDSGLTPVPIFKAHGWSHQTTQPRAALGTWQGFKKLSQLACAPVRASPSPKVWGLLWTLGEMKQAWSVLRLWTEWAPNPDLGGDPEVAQGRGSLLGAAHVAEKGCF